MIIFFVIFSVTSRNIHGNMDITSCLGWKPIFEQKLEVIGQRK